MNNTLLQALDSSYNCSTLELATGCQVVIGSELIIKRNRR